MTVEDEVERLSKQMAALAVRDRLRTCRDMPMPRAADVEAFEKLCLAISGRQCFTDDAKRRLLTGLFGAPAVVMAKLWDMITDNTDDGGLPQGAKKEHLVWALHYLYEYPSLKPMCKTMSKDGKVPTEKTVAKWVWIFVELIADLEEQVIRWENRLKNDLGDDCTVSVDCTDCPFPQILVPNPDKPGKKMVNKALYSKKLNGPALRYEVCFALYSNDIVWVNGPFAPGDWNDLEIFRHALIHRLEPFERVMADNIYAAEAPKYVKCEASMFTTEEQAEWHRRCEGRHELGNRHLKFWKCLCQKYKGSGTAAQKMANHSRMFRATAVVKQIIDLTSFSVTRIWVEGGTGNCSSPIPDHFTAPSLPRR